MNSIDHINCFSHPEICEVILGQFAFMKAMSRPEDRNYEGLASLDLNYVFSQADQFFVNLTTFDEMIEVDEGDVPFSEQISEFLKEFKGIVDVTAIQQNIHNILIQRNR